jgi:receptor protein-tyrosine kinase
VLADGCVITTRFGKTRREQLAEAAATLSRIDATLLGVVLNRVPQAAAVARGYGYGYSYKADPGREATAGVGPRSHRRASGRRRRSEAPSSVLPPLPVPGGEPS